MKFLTFLTTAVTALALAGCGSTVSNNANNSRANVTNLGANNANTGAIVVNSNANVNRWNANITRAEYEKNKADYDREKGSSTIGQGANDMWLWVKTRSSLLGTSDLRESTINVDVVNDVVTLKGSVATAAQKSKAEEVAKGIEGVKSVKNELKVAPNDSMTNMSSNTNKK